MPDDEESQATKIARLEEEMYNLQGSIQFHNKLRQELEKDIRNLGVAFKEAAKSAPFVDMWKALKQMSEQQEWLGDQMGDRVQDIVDIERRLGVIEGATAWKRALDKKLSFEDKQKIYDQGFNNGQLAANIDNHTPDSKRAWVARNPDASYVKMDSGSEIVSKPSEDPKRGGQPDMTVLDIPPAEDDMDFVYPSHTEMAEALVKRHGVEGTFKRLKVARKTLRRWRNGTQVPSLDSLAKVITEYDLL